MTEKKPHKIYYNDELKYELQESYWYDTATPAQYCIGILKNINRMVPNIIIESYGKNYSIKTTEELKNWVKEVFSEQGVDFSKYIEKES